MFPPAIYEGLFFSTFLLVFVLGRVLANSHSYRSEVESTWGKTETISPKIRNETKVATLSTLILHSFGIPSRTIRQEEK
jgi:hypothetical protein